MNTKQRDLLGPLIACPRCAGALTCGASSIDCACGAQFPFVDGMPWLMPDPEAMLEHWRGRMKLLLQHVEGEAAALDGELKRTARDAGMLALTRQRLTLLRDAKRAHRNGLEKLLAPLALTPAGSLELSRALKHRLPVTQSLTGYYANLHRDWAWGDAENAAGLACVREVAGEGTTFGKLLVLGAGACRLAYDAHRALRPELTVALDFNPLMMMVARRVLAGETVSLHEFPIAPKDLGSVAVQRELRAPAAVGDGFALVFGDALQPPFAAQSFDTVLTPWLIDIVPAPLERTAAEVNRLLKPGGVWLEFGSLAFDHREPGLNYSLEELHERVAAAGFEVVSRLTRAVPYMQSPASLHGRVETVVCFAARKVAEVDARRGADAGTPEWLVDAAKPIPRLAGLDAVQTMHNVYFDVVSAIDGQRSLRDISVAFAAKYQMRPEEAQASLHGFLVKLFDELRSAR